MRLSQGIAALLAFSLAGCQTVSYLDPSSAVPSRWAKDQRTKNCGDVRITFSESDPSRTVVAKIVCKEDSTMLFKDRGTTRWAESDYIVSKTPAENLTLVYTFGTSEQFYRIKPRLSGDSRGRDIYLQLIKEVELK